MSKLEKEMVCIGEKNMSFMQKTMGFILKKPLDTFGNQMKKTSLKFQFESTLAGYGLVLLSLTFLFGYQVYHAIMGISIGWSIFYALNAFCGILIIYSQMVSTFMSYLQITALTEAQSMLEKLNSAPDEVKDVVE